MLGPMTYGIQAALQSGVVDPRLVYDEFTDANDTALSSHTPDVDREGGGWTQQAGTFYIQGNHLEPNSHANNDVATIDAGESDCVITCKVRPYHSSGSVLSAPSILLRYSNTSNYWFVELNSGQGFSGSLRIAERSAGTVTNRALASDVGVSSGTQHTLEITLDAQSISVTLDGGAPLAYASAALNETATLHGVRVGVAGAPGDKAEWEDFTINP